MNKTNTCRVLWKLMLVVAFAPVSWAAEPAIPDFCFLQVSDIHVSPHPAGTRRPEDARGVQTITWVCEQAKTGQQLDSPAMTTPAPAFVIATGDLTEYGVIGETWEDFEECFKPLSVPLYVVPGNHDNTWTSIMPIMRKRHGADHYSFDQFGCHFVGLDSATIQEPLPSLEARTLNWLRDDLKGVPKDRPVFVFQHHPLSSTEFAAPFEQLRFLDAIREHNVVLLLMGHGHNVRAERWNTLDSVMGGSTFGPNAGYNIISVAGGVLRVTYRYSDAAKPMQKLLEKPLAHRQAPTLELIRPAAGTTESEATIAVEARLQGTVTSKVTVDVDGRKEDEAILAGQDGQFHGSVPTDGLLAGSHYLHVKAEGATGELERAVQFLYRPAGTELRAVQVMLSAGMKAGPIPVEGGCLVAATGGQVAVVPFESGPAVETSHAGDRLSRTLCDTGVEIIHAPAVVGETIYFSSGELGVFSVGLDGKLNWRRPVGAAVYGTPAVVGNVVYVGDMEGSVHALDRKTGAIQWSKHHATFSIEMPLVAGGGVLYFGAWDGHLYVVNAADGTLKWKQPGPAGQTEDKTLQSRYYAPADCPPVVIGEQVFVCDRSYRLGSYGLDGKYLGQIAENVAAIGPAEDGRGFYARGLEKGITRYDGEGRTLWSQPLMMGRFPCPPTAVGGRVYACSNLGILSALNAADGKVLWQYQASPRLHVMAPVGADVSGSVYVAGMDGVVQRLR